MRCYAANFVLGAWFSVFSDRNLGVAPEITVNSQLQIDIYQ
jgi:hypothetical protein